jgi:uncharacterized protein (UPF0332 family)
VTEENRRKNIAGELARAREALAAADALLALNLHSDCVSRAYYGALHFLKALLLTRGIEAKTHSGAIHIFNLEFVRSGGFPTAYNVLLSGMQGSRQLADYDAAASFSASDARSMLDEARTFGKAVTDFLAKEGHLP